MVSVVPPPPPGNPLSFLEQISKGVELKPAAERRLSGIDEEEVHEPSRARGGGLAAVCMCGALYAISICMSILGCVVESQILHSSF